MKIGKKITVGFLVIVTIFVTFGYSIYLNEKSIETVTSHFSNQIVIELNTLQELKSSTLSVLSSTMEIVLLIDERDFMQQLEIEKKQRLLGKRNFENAFDVLYDLTIDDPLESDNTNNIKEKWDVFLRTSEDLIEAKESGVRGIEILELREKLEEAEIDLLKVIDDSLEHEFDEVIAAGGVIDSSFSANFQIIIWGIVTVVISSIIIGLNISNSISKPINSLRKTIDKIRRGEEESKIDAKLKKSKDEIGNLAIAFDEMRSSMKKSNAELSASEIKYRNLYESSPDLYRTINTDGIILDCNESYAKNLGYTKNEVIRHSIFDHVSDIDHSAMHKSFEIWKKTGRILNRNVIFKRKDSSTFPVIVTANSLYDDNGKLIGSNTIIRDMSELRDAEKKIEYEKMKRLTAIGELSASIAHDIRNPVSVIRLSNEIIKRVVHDEKGSKAIKLIDRSIRRITHQLDQVLDFVRTSPIKLEKFSLNHVLEGLIKTMEIPPNISINMPQDDFEVLIDRSKMESIFYNIFFNAIQAIENQKGTITIRISEEGDMIKIEFEDDGPNIPDEVLPKIFEPLFTTKQKGTGLGLSAAKNSVEQHGGTISVTNNPVVFTIKLPKLSMSVHENENLHLIRRVN